MATLGITLVFIEAGMLENVRSSSTHLSDKRVATENREGLWITRHYPTC